MAQKKSKMEKINQLKELENSTGFSPVYKRLRSLIKELNSATQINQSLEIIASETMQKVNKIKEAFVNVSKKWGQIIERFQTAESEKKEAETKLSELKRNWDLLDSDMELMEINPLKSWSFVILSIGIILLDYLVGGVMVFQSNQSPFISSLLMLAAILAAFFFYLAAPGFAVKKRLKAEAKKANHEIKGTLGTVVNRQYEQQPELALPYWMRPSSRLLSHNEGEIFYSGAWIVKRKQVMAWVWLLFGTFFSFIRLIPVLIDPTLYGENSIWIQVIILVVALIVNSVIFLLELWRRRNGGLPNEIQKPINKQIHRVKNAEKILQHIDKKKTAETNQKQLLKTTEELLMTEKSSYQKKVDDAIRSNASFELNFQKYEADYIANKATIDAFMNGLHEIGFSKEEYQSEIPDPETLQKTILREDPDNSIGLEDSVFKITNDQNPA